MSARPAVLVAIALLAPWSAAAQSPLFQPPSCENMKGQRVPNLPGLTYRVVAVDEEMGAVLLWQNFGPGSLPGRGNAPSGFITFEAFKVYGGKIHAAEAILETLPIGAPSGWDK